MPVMITLNQIKSHNPCISGWKAILRRQNKTSADDEEFPLVDAFNSNSIEDVIWALRCIDHKDISVVFSRGCANRAKKYAEAAAASAIAAIASASAASAASAAASASTYAADAAYADTTYTAAVAAAASATAAVYAADAASMADAADAAAIATSIAVADVVFNKERLLQKEHLIQLLS
jgi:hypothetical protein